MSHSRSGMSRRVSMSQTQNKTWRYIISGNTTIGKKSWALSKASQAYRFQLPPWITIKIRTWARFLISWRVVALARWKIRKWMIRKTRAQWANHHYRAKCRWASHRSHPSTLSRLLLLYPILFRRENRRGAKVRKLRLRRSKWKTWPKKPKTRRKIKVIRATIPPKLQPPSVAKR